MVRRYDSATITPAKAKRLDDKVFEYTCHEHNYALANILHIARLGKQTSLKPPPDKADKDAKDKDAKKDKP